MKNIFFICFCVLFTTIGCTDDDDILSTGESTNIELLPSNKPNDVLDERLFEVINLDYPGLEKVKSYYEANEYYYAAHELLKYYRDKSDISNPNINLINPTITASEQNIADQALDYRFYVRNFKESTDASGNEIYYSFKKDGKIDWDFVPAEITDQEFKSQKHRHQWMLPQAKAYRVNKDEKYFQSWMDVYSDWLNTFPCPESIVDKDNVQWYGLQPAERVLSQIDILPYFIQSTNFTPEWLSVFLTAFADEVECIRKNYFTDGSNIYVTQVQAVTTAGMLMPEFKNSTEWLLEGSQKISEQVTDQFLADGVQVELDPSYHIGVVDGFYNIYKLAMLNGKLDLFPSNYIELLKKASRFVMDIIYPNYTIDNFNDTRSSSYSKNVILKNLKKNMEMFPEDEEIRWMATEGKQGTKPTGLVQVYDAAGYYMLRSGWEKDATMMILKNNKNTDNKWHCQPDNGTFGLYHNGRNFCPDAGVYSYGGTSSSNADRAAFAATAMHNTMTIDKKDIAKGYMNGQLLLQESKNNIDILVTENKSYSNLTHRRAVFFIRDKKAFVLVDEGYGTGSTPTVNLNFKLCPSKNDVEIDDESANYQYGAHTIFADGNNMMFKTFVETTEGYNATFNTAYISEKLGEKTYQRKFYQVDITKPENGAARFITVICPFEKESDLEVLNVSAKFTDNDAANAGTFHASGASVEVNIGTEKYELSYTL